MLTSKTLAAVVTAGVSMAVTLCSADRALAQQAEANQPSWAEQRVGQVAQEYPAARIRVTGRQRNVERQAELMVDAANRNPDAFLRNYGNAPYAQDMVDWLDDHPDAPRAQAVQQFASQITQARVQGARVSDHLNSPDSNRVGVDISVPVGDASLQNQVQSRLQQQGARVNRHEETGDHWHLSVSRRQGSAAGDTNAAPVSAVERVQAATGTGPDACYTNSAFSSRVIMDDNAPRSRTTPVRTQRTSELSPVSRRQPGTQSGTAALRMP